MSKSEYYYEQGANHCYTCGHSRHSHNTSPEDSTCYVCDSCNTEYQLRREPSVGGALGSYMPRIWKCVETSNGKEIEHEGHEFEESIIICRNCNDEIAAADDEEYKQCPTCSSHKITFHQRCYCYGFSDF